MTEQDANTYPDTELQRAQEAVENLTPQAYLDLESVVNSTLDNHSLPEAGGIAFTEFEGAHGGVIHVTARATHPTRAVQMVLESFSYLKSLQPGSGWHIPSYKAGKSVPVSTPVQSQSQPVQPQAPSTNPSEPQYVDVDTGAPQSAPAQPAQQYKMQTPKIVVTPMPAQNDGLPRVKLELYAAGHKWPDLRIINWTAQSVLDNVLDPAMGWDISILQQAAEYTGNYYAIWEYSPTNFNKNNEPYKDVKKIGVE